MDSKFIKMFFAMQVAHEKEMDYCKAKKDYDKAKKKLDNYLNKHKIEKLTITWYNRIRLWYYQKKAEKLWQRVTVLYAILKIKFANWKIANENYFKLF